VKKLYVGNLTFSTTESDLREMFAPYGAVESVSLVTDRDTGRSRGFAFVEMTNDTEAASAISGLNGQDSGGRALTVNEAKPKAERSGGGGGRGDSRGRSRERRW
jgi:cold-inducible RNA-binding protein